MRLEATIQRQGLDKYVERFQTMDAALTLAGVKVSDERKVIRFLKGIREREDRLFVISGHKPANLKEAYQAVVDPCPVLVPCPLGQAQRTKAPAGPEAKEGVPPTPS
jgi:hypothetical protein